MFRQTDIRTQTYAQTDKGAYTYNHGHAEIIPIHIYNMTTDMYEILYSNSFLKKSQQSRKVHQEVTKQPKDNSAMWERPGFDPEYAWLLPKVYT